MVKQDNNLYPKTDDEDLSKAGGRFRVFRLEVGLGCLRCLTPLSTIFQLYRGGRRVHETHIFINL